MSMESPSQRADPPSALPRGTRLGEFELLQVLGSGGFGIVYLAFDHALEREVAIKEYMPASLVGRTATLHVSLRSQSDAETFTLGLKSFVNEARLLARFDHPSLLKVLRFWEANGTAYMAMPVLRGQTIKEMRPSLTHPPSEAWLRALLAPLLGAIEKLHSEGVYHRDIAPDNIQIEPDGRPVLLDFGAARRVISDKSQTLTAILKPAYAPIEQYAEVGSVKQGPWTDLYALGATVHYLLMGRPPAPATARMIHDDQPALAGQAIPACSVEFLRVIDWMLAPRPTERPQSVAELREALAGERVAPQPAVVQAPVPSSWERTVIIPKAQTTRPHDPRASDTIVVPRTPPAPVRPTALARPDLSAGDAAPAAAARSSRAWPWVLAGVAVLAGAAALAKFWPQQSVPLGADLAASAPVAALAASVGPAAVSAAASGPFGASASEPVGALPASPIAKSPANPSTPTSVPTPAAPAKVAAEPARSPPRSAPAQTPTAAAPLVAPLTTQSAAVAPPAQAAPSPVATPTAEPAGARPATAQAPRAAPLTPPTPAARPSETRAAKGPEATCEGRSFLSSFVCMERECLRSENQAHADCLKWRSGVKRE